MMVRSIASLALVPLICAAAPQQKLEPTYKQAIRCAALSGAQVALLPQGSTERATVNDAGRRWVRIIVTEMNDKGMDQDAVYDEAKAARAKAGEELAAGDAKAKAELAACITDAPDVPLD
jgi:hypothetical protein